MLFEIALSIATVAISGVTMLYVGKRTANNALEEAEYRFLDYIRSTEAIQDVGTLGAAFGRGVLTQVQLGNVGKASGLKIGGFKIPQAIIDTVMASIFGTQQKQGEIFGTRRTPK